MSDLPPPPPAETSPNGPAGGVPVVPAPLGRRIGAVCIDAVIVALFGGTFFAFVFYFIDRGFSTLDSISDDPGSYAPSTWSKLGPYLWVLVVFDIGLLIWFKTLGAKGTSPGGKLFGLSMVYTRTGELVTSRRKPSEKVTRVLTVREH